MGDVQLVVVMATAFVGTHFLLSHPLRRPLVAALGERGFLGLYSLVAGVTLGGTVWAFIAAPAGPLWWSAGDGTWALATLLMLIASVLLMGSLVGNPALVNPAGPSTPPAEARGVYAVTRHPMMWAFAIWAGVHVLVYPAARNVAVAVAIAALALIGAAMQDRKKAQLDPVGWPAWQRRTSYWPFAAIAAGRARLGGFGMHAVAGGLVVWLVATWAHGPLAGWSAGIWRWIG